MNIYELIAVIIYGIVGIISLIMAFKSLVSKRFILFHEKASGVSWADLDSRLQKVILALMKVSGLGFFIVALILLVFPVVNYLNPDEFLRYAVPSLAFVFCLGLFLVNYSLYRQTKSRTPWMGSLFCLVALIAGIILSILE